MKETILVYGGLLLSILVLALIKNRKIYNCITLSMFILILGLRSPIVGADTLNYISHFYDARLTNISLKQFLNFEPGYIILNKFIGIFTNNGQVFLFVISLFMIFLFERIIAREIKLLSLGYFLFVTFAVYFQFFVIIRQVIASLILWSSIRCARKREFIKFIIYVILAMSFHKTAIIFIFLYFFIIIKLIENIFL